jgi:hypothetical protein
MATKRIGIAVIPLISNGRILCRQDCWVFWVYINWRQLQRTMRLVFSLPLLLIGFAAVLPAQPASTSAHERSLLVESFAREKLSQWQKRLNLQDWDVTLEVVRSTELRPRTLGNIHWDNEKKTAVIRVLDPADYRLTYQAMLDDMEFTVVHELIHLEISPVLSHFARSDADRSEEEHAVNHMADALLHLDRGR